jgi:hypothetical protein
LVETDSTPLAESDYGKKTYHDEKRKRSIHEPFCSERKMARRIKQFSTIERNAIML